MSRQEDPGTKVTTSGRPNREGEYFSPERKYDSWGIIFLCRQTITPWLTSPRSEGRVCPALLSLSRVPAVRVELALLALECLGSEIRLGEGGRSAELSLLGRAELPLSGLSGFSSTSTLPGGLACN